MPVSIFAGKYGNIFTAVPEEVDKANIAVD